MHTIKSERIQCVQKKNQIKTSDAGKVTGTERE